MGRREFALEVAAAQVCREAGPQVSTNQFVRDLDLGEFNGLDGRRLEVIADGLSLWRGAQLAIDTTLVSPLHRDGTARRGAADRNGVALDAARRKRERAYPVSGDEGRARLLVLAAEVGGRWSNETAQFLYALAEGRFILQGRAVTGPDDATVSEMINNFPLEIDTISKCVQERFMSQMETPSSWKIVKLVFLRRLVAAPPEGSEVTGQLRDINDVEVVCILLLFFSWKGKKELENWKNLHVARVEGTNCQHVQVKMTNLWQKHCEWQEDRTPMS